MVLIEPRLPPAAAPLSMSKGRDDARASPSRSSLQGWVEHPREESTPEAPPAPEVLASGTGAGVPAAQEPLASQAMATTSPPPPSAAPLYPGSSASPDVLERALSVMALLREDLQGTDRRLVAGRLELVSGWLCSDVSIQVALS